MTVESVPAEHSPLNNSKYLVMEFDPSNAGLEVFGDVGYSERNLGDALRDAQDAAEDAARRRSNKQYVVVSLTVMGAYRAAS